MNLHDRVIVALDVEGTEAAYKILNQVPEISYVKVGMELFFSAGPNLIRELKKRNLKLFLDLKVHDIPNTAAGAIRSLKNLGSDLINLHCSGGLEMMRQARDAAGDDCILIGVTQLTSTDQAMLNNELKIDGTVADAVLHYALLAKQAGLNGVVCAASDVPLIKEHCGSDFITVTPGIRPAGSGKGDQKRIMTPAEAIKAGSDYLVIGRPITASPDPRLAFLNIIKEMETVI